jgi:hypothetical protein
MENEMNNDQAKSDLQAVNDARRNAAGRFKTAWWFHIAVGVVLGAFVVTIAHLAPGLWTGAILVLLVIGEVLRRVYRQRMRVWGYGWRAGRAAFWNIGIALAGIGAILLVEFGHVDTLTAWITASVLCIVSIGFGVAFDATLRRRIQHPVAL